MREPDPRVIDELCRSHPRALRSDLSAAWKNAHLHWFVEPKWLLNEPPELTAARYLFACAVNATCAEDRPEYYHCMWTLVAPYQSPR